MLSRWGKGRLYQEPNNQSKKWLLQDRFGPVGAFQT